MSPIAPASPGSPATQALRWPKALKMTSQLRLQVRALLEGRDQRWRFPRRDGVRHIGLIAGDFLTTLAMTVWAFEPLDALLPVPGPRGDRFSNKCSAKLTSMDEPLEVMCLDCPGTVIFSNQPGCATCHTCAAQLYLTGAGAVGVFPNEGWKPGRFGRER
jgi:hypothetical protein